MSTEPKPFASLSSGLLARKGAARPAMRPQGFGQGVAGLEDLGWNDMGFEPPRPAATPVASDGQDGFGDALQPQPLRNPLAGLTPVQSPVHSQQAEIADRLSTGDDEQDDELGEEFDQTAEPLELGAESELQVPFAGDPAAEVETVEEPFDPNYSPVMVKPSAVAASPVAAPVTVPVAAPARRAASKSRAAPGSKAKAAFTLRLDPDRHLKLRLACAVSGRSAQLLVTDALDALLSGMPELDAMAEKANRKG